MVLIALSDIHRVCGTSRDCLLRSVCNLLHRISCMRLTCGACYYTKAMAVPITKPCPQIHAFSALTFEISSIIMMYFEFFQGYSIQPNLK